MVLQSMIYFRKHFFFSFCIRFFCIESCVTKREIQNIMMLERVKPIGHLVYYARRSVENYKLMRY